MRILITGAAGMIGRKLVVRLMADGRLNGNSIKELHLHDVIDPTPSLVVIPTQAGDVGVKIQCYVSNLTGAGVTQHLVATKPDVIFHLAGVVSGEAEVNFDLGYQVNLDGTRALFEAIRAAQLSPRVVFTSSIAVFGAPFPEVIPDDFHLTPLTSYGTQKMMSEALLADYSRREIFDGIGIRLPTICVRPGKPNKAASGFFSSIIREPLVGVPAILPVPRDVVHSHASPRSAVNFLIHAAGLDGELVGTRRNLTMPGVGVSVQEQIDALGRIAGHAAQALISDKPDAAIWAIVKNWPTRFEAKRARDLGFVVERNFDEIIMAHIDDCAQ